MRVTIWATHQAPGFHRWPGAPDTRDYLRDRHRHMFHIRAEVDVTHGDRDVEFHDLQDVVRTWWGPEPRELGSCSCEHLAQQLAEHLTGAGFAVVRIDVSEDGENGATLHLA